MYIISTLWDEVSSKEETKGKVPTKDLHQLTEDFSVTFGFCVSTWTTTFHIY